MTSDEGTNIAKEWEPVIGLEIHAQLRTRTKLFCACETSFGHPPNVHTCPVCLGLPGALPVMNAEALRLAVLASVALECTVHEESVFARKNYFYPDSPKGYQLSQYDRPLATGGRLVIDVGEGPRTIGVTRLHIEEDAGKTVHGRGHGSLVDLNRAGTPLAEVVSEPELRSPAEARAYMKAMCELFVFIGANDGNLEQGSLRCDANVSLRRRGESRFGTRVELKNINSFRFVEEALELEIGRQIMLLERGEPVRRQTRGYNADRRETYLLRDKEVEEEYRYFPCPDLPPLVVDASYIEVSRRGLPELPAKKRIRYVAEFGLSESAAGVLTGHPNIAAMFEAAAGLGASAIKVANFIQGEVLRDAVVCGAELKLPITAAQTAELVTLVEEGAISGKQAKAVYAAMRDTDQSPRALVASLGLAVMSDRASLEALAATLVKNNERQAAQYRGGKTGLFGFFVGQLMKMTGGSAEPTLARAVLEQALRTSGSGEDQQ
ncbi:MAG: Asp-tRNA(Asn)/Glu-tRNA(Gln) amidotransferase subunit GatB [Myxococcales bacterium]|nr:Asp-tRNA(Asn)/Glu-tRNA(Gln) amidotransferase subunit GatB [Myxococcales bacterium]